MSFWKQVFCEHVWKRTSDEGIGTYVEMHPLRQNAEFVKMRITEKCVRCDKQRQFIERRYSK